MGDMDTTKISLLQQLIAAMQKLLGIYQQQPPVPTDPILYTKAVLCLDTHITLDPTVPADVGCAEAVSYVMDLAGINDGPKGIAGTAALDAWLASSKLFTKVLAPQVGAIVVAPTGEGNGTVEGHTGIVAKYNLQYPNDWGILSNNSNNGKFMEQWSLSRFMAYYHVQGGLPVNYYVYTPPTEV